jgi:hypothetical protein
MHPKLAAWDRTMKTMFDQIDKILEDRHGHKWKLRRNRPERGETANPQADGLFDVGVFFTPGYGSEYGRGYSLKITLATEEKVASGERESIEQEVLDLVEKFLPEYFPNRELDIVKDGKMYKLIGDLSLGKVYD